MNGYFREKIKMKKLILGIGIIGILFSCNHVNDIINDNSGNITDNYKTPQEIAYKELSKVGNVTVFNGGFGSGAAIHPVNKNEFYLITDRGANIDYSNGKKFLTPSFTPSIGHYRINKDGKVELLKIIQLKTPSGKLITGLPNPAGKGATGEIPYDMAGKVLPFDDYGLDSESIVAANDGTFWVSDEYGPHIVHYSADGIELERISPTNVNTGGRKIPAVFEKRKANKGMEGLCITPDQKTLVGIMQSTLAIKGATNKTMTRILAFDLATGATKQYLYEQDGGKSDSNSDIVAISNSEFLVIERDGNFGSQGGIKKVYKINITNATDVSSANPADIDGKLVNGKPLEANTWTELALAGIKPVSKTLAVDLVSKIGYEHDKFEGLIYLGNNKIAVFNDDDFGVTTDAGNALIQKILPKTGKTDHGTMYVVNIN